MAGGAHDPVAWSELQRLAEAYEEHAVELEQGSTPERVDPPRPARRMVAGRGGERAD